MLEGTKIFAESWNVAWRKASPGAILQDTETEFTVVKNSFRYWAADPFLFEYKDDVYIFSELYDYIRRRGILGYYKLSGQGKAKWTPVIVENYHMSYPYIFRVGQDIYIMPEANASETLYVYKTVRFPDKWEKCKVLRNHKKYADTTPFQWNGKNRALTYQVKDPYHPQLWLLDLDNEANDVQLNLPRVERRRSAGKVFALNEKNIRPAQNCVEGYGKGLIFYEYMIAENGTYSETEVKELFPEQLRLSEPLYLDGMHTYNCSEHYEVVDIKTRRFNALNLFFRFFGKIADAIKR